LLVVVEIQSNSPATEIHHSSFQKGKKIFAILFSFIEFQEFYLQRIAISSEKKTFVPFAPSGRYKTMH
jgi:hypothetical protein